MTTYTQIQKRVRETDGFTPKTCHIAHVKSELNPRQRRAANRINRMARAYPCPPHQRPAILAAIEYLERLGPSN